MPNVPCGSHDVEFKGSDCLDGATHENADDGRLLCWLAEGHDGPHFDAVDGHWQISEDGTVELSRCQKVVTAQ